MKRGLWLTTLYFFAAGIILRLPFRSQFLYHWDSVNFAFGLFEFDILNHQPQPPGYILYILLGRLFKLVFVEANASLVWVSVLFSGLAIAALYWVAARLFDDRVGLAAGVLGLTSPLIWFYSEVALNYIIDAFFVTVLAYACYRQLQGDGRFVIPAALLLGLAGGFRQTTLVFLFPLWLFSLKGVGWGKRVTGTAVLGAVVVGWMAIMIVMSGGWDAFWLAMMSQSGSNLGISAASSVQFLLLNLARLGLFTFYGLMLAALVLPVFVVRFIRHFRQTVREPVWQVLLLWILPSLLFYLIFVQQAGYTFTYLPAVFILIAFTLARVIAPWARQKFALRSPTAAMAGVLVAANVAFFLLAQPYLFGSDKFLLRTPSAHAIRDRDTVLGQKIDFIRAQFPPEETLVLAGGMDFRIPDFYLADYRMPFISHDLNQLTAEHMQQAGSIRYLVLLNELPPYPNIPLEALQSAMPSNPLYWTELGANDELVLSKQEGVALRRRATP